MDQGSSAGCTPEHGLTYEIDYNVVPPGQRKDRPGISFGRTRQAVIDMEKKVDE